jgi:hypothetical protein
MNTACSELFHSFFFFIVVVVCRVRPVEIDDPGRGRGGAELQSYPRRMIKKSVAMEIKAATSTGADG